MSNTNDDTPSLQESLCEAHRSGRLMEAIDETNRTTGVEREDIARVLVTLHNLGTIDIVEAFSELRKSEAGYTFFGLRGVFEHALPELESDVITAIRCVHHLYG